MTCHACGKQFEARRRDQRFCSAECRLTSWHEGRQQKQTERDAQLRLHLRTAQQSLNEAQQLLTKEDDDGTDPR